MNEYRIQPEKITHPFQLMACWFVMLLGLESILLTAAAKIDSPSWASGFLVIFAAVMALGVTLAVFLMLTKFRPHLQGEKEYAEWLKDERRFGKGLVRVAKSVQPAMPFMKMPSPKTLSPELFQQVSTCPVQISALPGDDEMLTALARVGFRASIYDMPEDETLSRRKRGDPSKHESIWVGSRVPTKVVVLAIKTAVEIWPHLKYVHLSDNDQDPPDSVHDEIFLGGSTETAHRYKLKPWMKEELLSLPEDLSLSAFHKLVREKYP